MVKTNTIRIMLLLKSFEISSVAVINFSSVQFLNHSEVVHWSLVHSADILNVTNITNKIGVNVSEFG